MKTVEDEGNHRIKGMDAQGSDGKISVGASLTPADHVLETKYNHLRKDAAKGLYCFAIYLQHALLLHRCLTFVVL